MPSNLCCYSLKIDYYKCKFFYKSQSKQKAKTCNRYTKEKKKEIQVYHYRKSSSHKVSEQKTKEKSGNNLRQMKIKMGCNNSITKREADSSKRPH